MFGIERVLVSFIALVCATLLAFPAYAHHEISIPTGFESLIILGLLSGVVFFVYRRLIKNGGESHNR